MCNYRCLNEGWVRRAIAVAGDASARREHRFGLNSVRLGQWTLVGLFVFAPRAGEAQRMDASVPESFSGVVRSPSAADKDLFVRRPYERGDLPPDEQSSVVPYVIGGALIGAAAMTVGLVLYFRSDRAQDSITHPLMLTPAVLGAGAVGAAAGWLIHRLRTR